MFEIIFITALAFYFLQLIVFSIGAGKKFNKISPENLPLVSVIVAARNEENNILDCISSLDKLDYPDNKLEIIIVNDHSTDSTAEIVKVFIAAKPKFILIVPEQIGTLKGKTNALANAIKAARGEIIITTDADCIVPANWVKSLASYFTERIGFVGGFTAQKTNSAFSGMQSIDFLYLLTVAAGALNLGKPLSCIGNNMAFRKSAYDEIGGYEKLPFSVTEDFNLLMAIFKSKNYDLIYPLDEDALVTSKPCPDLKTLFWQKKRWGVGGMKSDLIGYSVMAWGFIAHAFMLLTFLFFSTTALYLCLFKIFVDYFFILPVYSRLKLELNFIHFAAFEIYFIFYVLILPFAVLPNKKVKWKGREF